MYYLKIEENNIVEAPSYYEETYFKDEQEYIRIYTKFNIDINAKKLVELGYMAYPKSISNYEIIDGKIIEKTVEPITRTIFSKLEIVEAFSIANKMDVLSELLTDTNFNLYWISANEIDLNHEITIEAINTLDSTDNDISSTEIIAMIGG